MEIENGVRLIFITRTHILCKEVCNEKLLKTGREYASRHNISFNVMVRRLIEQTVNPSRDKLLDDSFLLMDTLAVSSEGESWTREDLHRV